MGADGGAIVAGANLRGRQRSVALIAEGLALIGADSNGAIFVEHLGHRQFRDRNVLHFAAIKESKRRTVNFLLAAGELLFFRGRFPKRRPFVMNLVASQTGNRGLIGECCVAQLPRADGIEWSREIAHGPLEMHAVAAQTIVHQNFATIVFGIEENVFKSGAVSAGLPIGEFGLMALFAAADHF